MAQYLLTLAVGTVWYILQNSFRLLRLQKEDYNESGKSTANLINTVEA